MRAIQDHLMPQLLQNFDHLETFVTKFGCHIFDLRTKSGCIKVPPFIVSSTVEKIAKEQKPTESHPSTTDEPQPSTSGIVKKEKKRNPHMIYSDSEEEEETALLATPPKKAKTVTFNSPLTDVKGQKNNSFLKSCNSSFFCFQCTVY